MKTRASTMIQGQKDVNGRLGLQTRQEPQRRAASRREPAINLKSLLVPTDFSDISRRALDCALPLAGRFGSEIYLTHVIERPADFEEKPPYRVDKSAVDRATKDLRVFAQNEIDEWVPTNVRVTCGRPYFKICETARELGSDLIVMNTHGHTGLKHVFLGSTAERVVRHAPCSVLTVRGREAVEKAGALWSPRRILVPIDFSKHSKRALDYAKKFAREFGAEIVLLYVVPTHYAISEYDQAAYCLWAAESKRTSERRLAAMCAAKGLKGVNMRAQTRSGRPAIEIAEAALAENCDLIVISTHGWTGWDHMLLGSTTEGVVRHAACPVLVYRKKNRREKVSAN